MIIVPDLSGEYISSRCFDKQRKRDFSRPMHCSTRWRAAWWATLYARCLAVVAFGSGTINHGCNPYPLSPSNHESPNRPCAYSVLSFLLSRLLFHTKLSCDEPPNRALMERIRRSKSHTCFNKKNVVQLLQHFAVDI